MSTQPTDAEIIAVAATEGVRVRTGAAAIKFARAVLEKWGTPAPVGAEPVAWWIPKAEQFALADKSGDRPFAKAWDPLYATPQPTQAQAGAVPLTREQVKAICVESGYETATLQERADFINGIRHAERHHGIKGGQHGTDET